MYPFTLEKFQTPALILSEYTLHKFHIRNKVEKSSEKKNPSKFCAFLFFICYTYRYISTLDNYTCLFILFTGNIQPPTSSDLYTCVASNEGGISEANVTLVFSPNVATYVGDGEAVISWLLTGGVASGVLIFLGK